MPRQPHAERAIFDLRKVGKSGHDVEGLLQRNWKGPKEPRAP